MSLDDVVVPTGSPRLVAEPATEPVSTSDLAEHLRVDSGADMNVIAALGRVAREHVEMYTRRQLVLADFDFYFDRWPRGGGWLEFPKSPLSSVVVQYTDADGNEQTLPPATYTVDTDSEPGRVYLAHGQSWPALRSMPKAIRVTATCGYGVAADVPETLKQLIRLATEEYYDLGRAPKELPMAFQRLASGVKVHAFSV